MKLLIGIPAYNEAQMIGKVLKSFPKKITGIESITFLVVDDGSEDNTANIAIKNGANVIKHLLNRGLGAALKTIFLYAKVNFFDYLMTFDADGQHKAKDIPKILKPIVDNQADVVISTRWKDSKIYPFSRYLVNKLANVLTYILFNIITTDSQSGLRAFNRQSIEKIEIRSDGMEVSSEFFKEIKRHGLKFCEVPIKAVYTDYSKRKGQKLSNAFSVFWRLSLKLLH